MADMMVLAVDNSAIIQSLSSAHSINSQEKVRVRDSLEAEVGNGSGCRDQPTSQRF